MKTKLTKALVVAVGIVFLGFSLLSCSEKNFLGEKDAPVTWAGFRSSTYGIRPFPAIDEWDNYAATMEGFYPGSEGAFVWIVGYVQGTGEVRTCSVNFPIDEKIDLVTDFPLDENEEFLNMCDEKGYSVWLQVEPGNADLVALATATMEQYKHHPSVKGFGIDVEWYYPDGTSGYGIPITDELAEEIDKAIKKVDKRFSYFLKHWDAAWMPPTYRSDIVFVNDSQLHQSLDTMKGEFDAWASYFNPNPVMYQIGYESDKDLWGTYENPEKDLGDFLAQDAEQHVGIIWVDFTLRDVMD